MADYENSFTVWNETVFYAYFGHDPRADTYQMPPARRALLLTFFYGIIFISLAVVGTRLYTRRYVSNAFGMDDWVIIPAESAFVGIIVTVICGIYKGGLGKPANLHTYAELIIWWKLHYALVMQSAIVIFLIRTHIILFLRRILPMQRPRIFTLLHVVNALHCTSSSLPWALICVPREMKIWNLLLFFQNHCYDQAYYRNIKLSIALLGVISAVLDFVLLGVPVVKVWRVSAMDFRRKLGICFVLGIGFSACVMSVVKVYFFIVWLNTPESARLAALLIPLPVLLAGSSELSLGILAASLPALHTLYRRRCTCTEARSWLRNRKSQTHSTENSAPWNPAFEDTNPIALIDGPATPQGASTEELDLELELAAVCIYSRT